MSSSAERTTAFYQDAVARELARHNPPGRGAVTYRGATYQNALARMLARLPDERVGPEDGSEPPLAHLNVEADDDWAVALVHAWAVVADVLSFYQERIVNEGYLRTATERRSVLELARSIGYELRPGVAASTYLAATVHSRPGEPPYRVDIPAGTAVQGLAPAGGLPQVFETSQAWSARSEWNHLKLANQDRPGTIWPGTTSIRLAGNRVSLQPGDQILIVEDDEAAPQESKRWLLAVVCEVRAEPGQDYTVVTWRNVVGKPGPDQPLRNARFYALRQVGGLFAYTQAAVDSVPAAGKRWRPAGIGLPQAEVHALAFIPEGQLFAGTAQDVFRSTDDGATWQPAPTGPLRRNVTALVADAGGALYAGTDEGGIYLTQDRGRNWAAMSGEEVVPRPKWLRKWLPGLFSAPLPKTTVRSLAIVPRRRKPALVAGTDDGVFRSMDQGKTWQPANFDLPGLDWKTGRTKTPVWALAMARRGGRRYLFAGTDAGVFRVRGRPRFWPLLIVALVLVFLLRSLSRWDSLVAYLLAWVKDMRDGLAAFLAHTLPGPLFRSVQDSLMPINDLVKNLPDTWPSFPEPWDVLNAPLTFLIDFLLVTAVAALLVFLAMAIGRLISSRPSRCLGQPVYALAADEDGPLFAGTADGVFRSCGPRPDRDGSWLRRFVSQLKTTLLQSLTGDWRLVTKDDDEIQEVRALMVSPPGAVLAGTATGELFSSDDDGEGWEPFDQGPKLTDVQAILVRPDRQFAGGTPVTDKNERRWFASQVEKGQIDLDQVVPAVVPKNWVLLQQSDDPRKAMPYRVAQATPASSQDLNRSGQFTRLVVDPDTDLDAFDRETTVVWAGADVLALYDDRPVCGGKITLAGVVPGLATGHPLIFSGKRTRVRVAAKDGELTLRSADGLQSAPLLSGELLQLLSSPQPAEPGDGPVRWHLKNRRGFTGFVTAHAAALVQAPAAEDDETVAEVAVVAVVDHEKQSTHITLRTPLKNSYDRPSVTIYGNVIHARQGRTVKDEVLGSGDGSQANQRFRLRQGPLSARSAPVPSAGEPGLAVQAISLAVQVNGVTWHQVPNLQGLSSDSRGYMVRQNARGNTDIIFGDGQRGARLPSGHEQVTATYSIGLGPEANLPAGSLTLLQSALPGIDSVTNPVPATGGAGPEDPGQARENAPLATRAVNRIVSLTDYEDFARRFPGVGKAQAQLLHAGPRDVLYITVADTQGKPIDETSDLYQRLVQAIDDNRDGPEPRVRVGSYEPVYFDLRARVLIDPDHRERQRDIEAALRTGICQSFACEACEFGQEVSAAELISLMHAVRGVVAVELVTLHRSTQEPGLVSVLRGSLARWQEGRLLPAEMLVMNAQEGIKLDLEVVP
jgi:hypothetical protein